MKRIINLLRGFLTDFWMLPLAVIIAFWHERIAMALNLFPPLNPEKVGNIIPAFIVWLLVMFIVRVYFFAQYPDVYKKSCMSKRNESWEELQLSQQFWCLRLERWVLIISFAIIYSAMM